MSTVSAANITTANGSTDLNINTGNTSSSKITVAAATGGVIVTANSTSNATSEFGAAVEIKGNANTFFEVVQQNGNTGTNASTDYLLVNDGGNNFTGFIDIGINGRFYSNSSYTITSPGDGYLFTANSNLVIGTQTSNSIIFHTGGTLAANERLRITSAGALQGYNGVLTFAGNTTGANYMAANVFSGAAPFPISSKVAFGATSGTFAVAPSLGTTIGTLALTANRQYFIPLYVPYVLTTTTLACEVTTLGTGSSIKMNIYASDSTGSPTGSPLGTDVTVSSATTGVKTGSFAVTLKPGLYWASMVCNATAPTIRTTLGVATIGISTLGATPTYSHIYGTFTYATMGAYSGVTSITGVSAATQVPLIGVY